MVLAETHPTHIDTGVDRLLRIVSQKKRISLEDAAAELGFEPALVQDWADFLEQDGLIAIDCTLMKTFLNEKKLSKAEVSQKSHEYEGKKEAFVRKVNVMVQQIDEEAKAFEQLKQHSLSLQDSLGDLGVVEQEVALLNHYEDLKKVIDQDIIKQRLEYQRSIDEVHTCLSAEEHRYDGIMNEIEQEDKRIKEERERVDKMRQDENEMLKRIGALQETIKTINDSIKTEFAGINEHDMRLHKMKELADRLRQEFLKERKRTLEPFLQISDDQEGRILRLQNEIIRKIRESYSQVESMRGRADIAAKDLGSFFERRMQINKIINDIERGEIELKQDLIDFILKAKAFDLAVKDSDMNSHIKELEAKYKEFADKKSACDVEVNALRGLLMMPGAQKDAKKEKDGLAGI